jgi:Tfp pilus assembly protein PilF
VAGAETAETEMAGAEVAETEMTETETEKAEAEKAKEAVAVEPAAEQPKAAKADREEAPPPAIPTRNLPRDPAKASDVLVHRALPLIRSGQLRVAEATLDRAWELDPRNPQAMAGYATLYLATKDGERAVKWAKKAVRKRSRRASYHVLYGDALHLNGDTVAARKAWRRALTLDPENRAARAHLAETSAAVAN